MHSFEEGFYVLSGEAIVSINEQAYRLRAGDYAVQSGAPCLAQCGHRAGPMVRDGGAAAQAARQGARHVLPERRRRANRWRAPLDPTDLRGNLLGHFEASQIPPVAQRTNVAPGLEGVFLKWMIDENFGSRHHRMLFIEYQPGVSIALHDHTFEEAYFILTGEVQGTMDGRPIRPGPATCCGRVSAACTLRQRRQGAGALARDVRADPARENVFRFMRDWDKRAKELEG